MHMILRMISPLACLAFIGWFLPPMIFAQEGEGAVGPSSSSAASPTISVGQAADLSGQDRLRALMSAGQEAESAGKNAEALANFESAGRIAPSDPHLRLEIGLLRGKAGDFQGARRAFERAIALQPDLAEAHYDLGVAIIGGSKQAPAWKEALHEFESALQLKPRYAEALNMSGVCLLETGNPTEAARRFQAALQGKVNSAGIHFNLGRALEATGHAQEALAEYTVSAEMKGPYPEAEIAIGNILLERGEYQESAAHLRKAYRQIRISAKLTINWRKPFDTPEMHGKLKSS